MIYSLLFLACVQTENIDKHIRNNHRVHRFLYLSLAKFQCRRYVPCNCLKFRFQRVCYIV